VEADVAEGPADAPEEAGAVVGARLYDRRGVGGGFDDLDAGRGHGQQAVALHPRAELLKRKSLAVEFPPLPKKLIVSRAFVGWLVERVERARPLVEWLAEETA